MKTIFYIAIVFTWFIAIADAANILRTGKEADFWKRRSVVYGTIVEAEQKDGDVIFVLLVRSTLTGSFDSAANGRYLRTLPARIGPNSSIVVVPQIASNVITLIEESTSGEHMITSNRIKFFPSEAAIEVVKDFGDPKVEMIMNSLRKIREPIR